MKDDYEKDYEGALQNLFEVTKAMFDKSTGIDDKHICLFLTDANALLKVLMYLQLNGYVKPKKGRKENDSHTVQKESMPSPWWKVFFGLFRAKQKD